jgi:hypothetical protein
MRGKQRRNRRLAAELEKVHAGLQCRCQVAGISVARIHYNAVTRVDDRCNRVVRHQIHLHRKVYFEPCPICNVIATNRFVDGANWRAVVVVDDTFIPVRASQDVPAFSCFRIPLPPCQSSHIPSPSPRIAHVSLCHLRLPRFSRFYANCLKLHRFVRLLYRAITQPEIPQFRCVFQWFGLDKRSFFLVV